MKNEPPFLITEREYWFCPVHVLTGLTWLMIGFVFGVIASYVA